MLNISRYTCRSVAPSQDQHWIVYWWTAAADQSRPAYAEIVDVDQSSAVETADGKNAADAAVQTVSAENGVVDQNIVEVLAETVDQTGYFQHSHYWSYPFSLLEYDKTIYRAH